MSNRNFTLTVINKQHKTNLLSQIQRKATILGIKGSICLIPDKGFKISAEGEEKSLNDFINSIGKFFGGKTIKTSNIEWDKSLIKDRRFTIKHSN